VLDALQAAALRGGISIACRLLPVRGGLGRKCGLILHARIVEEALPA
jgi:hypothetical protein